MVVRLENCLGQPTFPQTGPRLDVIMYIFTALEFPTHNSDFHLLTIVNAKYYY